MRSRCADWKGRRDRAGAVGQDAVFVGWQALASVALQDLTLWAQQLPLLIGYCGRGPPAASVLPYWLIRSADGQAILVALNDAPHPLFIPTSGKALAAKSIERNRWD